MFFFPLSAAINFLTSIIVCIVAVARDPKIPLNRSLGYFSFSVAFWSFCYFMWQVSGTAEQALYWSRALMMGGIFIPPAFLHLAVNLIEQSSKRTKSLILCYLTSGIFCVLNLTPLFVKDVRPRLLFQFWPTAGITFGLFLLFFTAVVLYAHVLLYKYMQHASGYKRNQIKYIQLGTAIGFAGGFTNYPLWFDIPMLPIGNILVSVYVILVFYTIVKYNLMDIRIAVTRAAISLIVYTVVLGFPFWLGHIWLSSIPLWYIPFIVGIALAFLGPLIYNSLKHKAENLLLAEQRVYQDILLQASEGMVHEHDLDKLLKFTVYIVKNNVKPSYAAIYLHDMSSDTFVLKAAKKTGTPFIHKEFVHNDPFIEYLETRRVPFTYEQLPDHVKKSVGNTDMGLIVPSVIKESCIGFMIIGHKLNRTLFVDDDIRTFQIISNQAATAVVNCMYTDRAKRDQELMLNAEKLALIGGMAAGVAHQFRNRLNNFVAASGEMQFAIEDFKNQAAQTVQTDGSVCNLVTAMLDCSKVIDWNVQRTTDIIQGVMNISHMQEQGITFTEFPMSELLNQAVSMLVVKHRIQDEHTLPLLINIDKDEILYGDKLRIFECLYNTIDNSYEALKEKTDYRLSSEEKKHFKPHIHVELVQEQDNSLIVIRDNGVGIKDENKKKVFAPFYTSKPSSKSSGSGIGTYFVKRNIEDFHNGKVWFESKYMEGTTFYFQMPRKPVGQQ